MKKKRYQREHAGARIQHEIRAHHTGDRSAGADAGDRRSDVKERVQQRCRNSADQIEHQIQHVPEIVLDIIAENPQRPHIEDQVQPRAVQKHGGEDGNDGRRGRHITRTQIGDEIPGHIAVVEEHDGEARGHDAEGKDQLLAPVEFSEISNRKATVFSKIRM